MDDWMRRNPGGVFVSVTLVSLSDTLWFTQWLNILAGFQKTGIFPLNTGIFKDADLVAAEITDRPSPTGGSCPPSLQSSTSLVIATSHTKATPSTSSGIQNDEERYVSPSMLFPAPNSPATNSYKHRKKRGKTIVLTNTPVKQVCEKTTRERMMPKAKSAKRKKTLRSHHRTRKLTLRLHLWLIKNKMR